MAIANQLKALIKSYAEGDESRFYSNAMQLAAHEAKIGHGKLAEEIRALIDQAKSNNYSSLVPKSNTVAISQPRGELADLLWVSQPKKRLAEMVLQQTLHSQLQRIIREQRQAEKLMAHALLPRRKLLLVGPPGTGKTLTAAVLAGELGLPLLQVRLDALMTKYMGETAAKLRQVFDAIQRTRGVYFFDEFDAIGSQRGLANDVGEIRRILNSFLQMIEQDQSHSLIIGATNHAEILDHALLRRFDDVLHYELPKSDNVAELLKTRLLHHAKPRTAWKRLAGHAQGLSYAEIVRACDEALKAAIIEGHAHLAEADIKAAIEERQLAHSRFYATSNER